MIMTAAPISQMMTPRLGKVKRQGRNLNQSQYSRPCPSVAPKDENKQMRV